MFVIRVKESAPQLDVCACIVSRNACTLFCLLINVWLTFPTVTRLSYTLSLFFIVSMCLAFLLKGFEPSSLNPCLKCSP
ncbi:hypothetical protein F5050DRAFT_1505710 [Lentinula boryana]|uniref:Uncharacterized protein n=1 Tax=Lentinula boryana TaxID=40481 RepID=A0ABQ8QEH5_9AGAR|nr:hypothetical protein F5050DRAFT_1505710 [Lentinula boryana]